MTVTVRLFASYAESVGRSEVEVSLEDGATVGDVVSSLVSASGKRRLPPSPLVAVNCVYATSHTLLREGDELAIIPPVAGG
jgi:molybdopterin converting factor subunit 1